MVGACGDEDFKQFSQLGKVQIRKVLTAKDAFEALDEETFRCIILDVKLSDMNGIDFMSQLRTQAKIQTPIIIYTDEEIQSDEIDDSQRYAESIILKSSKSKDRLMDEVSLFLHDVESVSPKHSGVSESFSEEFKSFEGVSVLLADDDNRNVYALMHLLEKYGMSVVVAKDGNEVVKAFSENDIQIVLMDIMMPGIDGYEAIKQIRGTLKGKYTPIIALTAKAMSDDRDKCIRAGANDYLMKPVEANRLLSMMKVWLS